jgi:Flp pilus assembly protein TadB
MNNYNSSNNNTKAQASGGGIGFVGLLTIAFIVLRLCGVITWSWIWVLSPIWISAALIVGILLIAGIIYLIALLIEKSRKSKIK